VATDTVDHQGTLYTLTPRAPTVYVLYSVKLYYYYIIILCPYDLTVLGVAESGHGFSILSMFCCNLVLPIVYYSVVIVVYCSV